MEPPTMLLIFET